MSHARFDTIEVANNQLCINAKPICSYLISEQPHYLYSKQQIAARIAQLRSSLPSEVRLNYAIKANPMPALLEFVTPLVDGLDVASAGEMNLALTKTQAERISFAGPAKQIAELEAAVLAGITVNVESPLELERLSQIAAEKGLRANVALRVNPDFELKQSGMQMAGGAKPFGIDAEVIPDLLQTIDSRHIALKGLHIFSGSQNLSHEALISSHRQTFELAQQLIDAAVKLGKDQDLVHVNIGGGFGIPYFANQQSLDLAPVAAELQQRLDERLGKFSQLAIVLELGRYIVGEAGYYLCQITDIKTSRGTTYLMVNGGLHHHLSNSGNFGQVIRKNYPTLLANKVDAKQKQTYEIAGPLCTPLDIVAAKIELPQAEVGDWVVVLQSGAYGFTASPQAFLGHPAPVERLI